MSDIHEALAESGEPMTASQIRKKLGTGVAKKAVNAALYAGGFAKVPDTSPPKWRVGEDGGAAAGGGGAGGGEAISALLSPAFLSVTDKDTDALLDNLVVTVAGARVPEKVLPALLVKLSNASKVVAVGPVAQQIKTWETFVGATVEVPVLESWADAVALARTAPKDTGAEGVSIVYTGGNHPLFWLFVNAFNLEGVVVYGL